MVAQVVVVQMGIMCLVVAEVGAFGRNKFNKWTIRRSGNGSPNSITGSAVTYAGGGGGGAGHPLVLGHSTGGYTRGGGVDFYNTGTKARYNLGGGGGGSSGSSCGANGGWRCYY